MLHDLICSPYLFLEETGWVRSFHLMTCNLKRVLTYNTYQPSMYSIHMSFIYIYIYERHVHAVTSESIARIPFFVKLVSLHDHSLFKKFIFSSQKILFQKTRGQIDIEIAVI